MKRLKHIKECMLAAIEEQMGHLDAVDAKELGEAVDMLKDISETMYYCSIVKAMEEKSEEEEHMYYSKPMHHSSYEATEMMEVRDCKEGKSGEHRKVYLESKEMHKDKSILMRELETYMQELSNDITEMLEESTPEERQLLQKKLSMLASKIG